MISIYPLIKKPRPAAAYKLLPGILLSLLIFSSTGLKAQDDPTWSLSRILNGNNVLPQNTVTGLYFDSTTGFLWIGTEGGLVRYNGIDGKIFDTHNVPIFKTPRIYSLFKTTDNRVMVMDKMGMIVPVNGDSLAILVSLDWHRQTPWCEPRPWRMISMRSLNV